jgi:hypothetical protein
MSFLAKQLAGKARNATFFQRPRMSADIRRKRREFYVRTSENSIQITVKINPGDYESLQKLSAKTYHPMSEIVREFIKRGLDVTRSKDDIDFVRKQLREELDIALKPQINRIVKLLMRIGMMTISFCYFTSKIVHLFVPIRDRKSYEELMAECKHNAAAYLNMRDSVLDAAFREFDENNR